MDASTGNTVGNVFLNDNDFSSEKNKQTAHEYTSAYPNWGALQRLPIAKQNNSNVEDFWTVEPLTSSLDDDSISRFKWTRHHIRPQKTLFAPKETKDGPEIKCLIDRRTTHVQTFTNSLTSIKDVWSDSASSQRNLGYL